MSTPYFEDEWLTVHLGDCREAMAAMEPGSVNCVVTSPPYWGLRDYGTASWVGGQEGCDHLGPPMRTNNKPSDSSATFHGGTNRAFEPWKDGSCGKCGAQRQDGQLGLEPTPEAYVEAMVAVFRELRRVLRDDGTVWLNLGDSYVSSNSAQGTDTLRARTAGHDAASGLQAHLNGTAVRPPMVAGLKPKDLVGIPWRVAFALQADGWYLRSDIIWSKPNPMPESVTDRPTKSHEYLFLLSKSARYYFDADAVREANATIGDRREGNGRFAYDGKYDGDREDGTQQAFVTINPAGRNLRSVWTIATQPYPGAHFATFPEALVEPCVKAGSSEKGVCPECGASWVRETTVEQVPTQRTNGREKQELVTGWDRDKWPRTTKHVETTGWRASCAHTSEPVPATVLDCFAGSGTTGLVANRLGRRAVLIDLSAEYLGQVMVRNAQTPLGLTS